MAEGLVLELCQPVAHLRRLTENIISKERFGTFTGCSMVERNMEVKQKKNAYDNGLSLMTDIQISVCQPYGHMFCTSPNKDSNRKGYSIY